MQKWGRPYGDQDVPNEGGQSMSEGKTLKSTQDQTTGNDRRKGGATWLPSPKEDDAIYHGGWSLSFGPRSKPGFADPSRDIAEEGAVFPRYRNGQGQIVSWDELTPKEQKARIKNGTR